MCEKCWTNKCCSELFGFTWRSENLKIVEIFLRCISCAQAQMKGRWNRFDRSSTVDAFVWKKCLTRLKFGLGLSYILINNMIKRTTYMSIRSWVEFEPNQRFVTNKYGHSKLPWSNYRVCHGFRLTYWDDFFWVNFDHFRSEPHF